MDYLKINKASWNNRLEAHYSSEFYDVEAFINGKSSLNPIELDLLGDISGLNILHLQCHFGQDTIALARMGANVVGVDLSDQSIKKAKTLNELTQTNCEFICSDVYDLPNHLDRKFDLVFTSYGTIGWLPDLDKWAKLISDFLKPKGELIFVDFHPVLWMYYDDFKTLKYNYFNTGPIREVEEGTYAAKDEAISQEYVMWNHSTAEVLTSLIEQNLEIKAFQEFDYSPYDATNVTVKTAPGQYRIKGMDNKVPLVFALKALKK